MLGELVVFWRLAGIRCVVVRHPPAGWQLRVLSGHDLLLAEEFADPHALYARAMDLRGTFANRAA